jgi:hypothetical protein
MWTHTATTTTALHTNSTILAPGVTGKQFLLNTTGNNLTQVKVCPTITTVSTLLAKLQASLVKSVMSKYCERHILVIRRYTALFICNHSLPKLNRC